MEVPVDYIRRYLSEIPFVRTIVLPFAFRLQSHLAHQLLNCLVIDICPLIAQLGCYATIAVTAVMFIVYLTYMLPDGIIAIVLSQSFRVVIECRTCHLLELQKEVKVVFRP